MAAHNSSAFLISAPHRLPTSEMFKFWHLPTSYIKFYSFFPYEVVHAFNLIILWSPTLPSKKSGNRSALLTLISCVVPRFEASFSFILSLPQDRIGGYLQKRFSCFSITHQPFFICSNSVSCGILPVSVNEQLFWQYFTSTLSQRNCL